MPLNILSYIYIYLGAIQTGDDNKYKMIVYSSLTGYVWFYSMNWFSNFEFFRTFNYKIYKLYSGTGIIFFIIPIYVLSFSALSYYSREPTDTHQNFRDYLLMYYLFWYADFIEL